MSDAEPVLVCPACGGEGPEAFCPDDGLRRGPRSSPEAPPDPLVGTVIAGRYAVERRLGHGGMGAVYLARQAMVDRSVVVKVVRADAERDERVRARFLREARAASRVVHPSVITIHDFGYTEDQTAYMVMEHVDGPSLDDLLAAEASVPWRRAARIIAAAARALDAAHRAGVVHRDVKPGNIMLAPSDGPGGERVKVLDFGLARVHDVDDQRLTRSGSIMGTPMYMAPEQASGREAGAPADVYALGVVLFELVTGDVPFRGQTVTDVLVKHVTEAPPRLLAAGAPVETPAALEALVHRCMAKSPDERPATAGEVADALEVLLAEGAPPPLVAAPSRGGEVASAETLAGTLEVPGLAASGVPPAAPRVAAVPPARVGPRSAPAASLTASSTETPASGRPRVRWLLTLALLIIAASLTFIAVGPWRAAAPPDPAPTAPLPAAASLPPPPSPAEVALPSAAEPPLPPPRGLRLDHLPLDPARPVGR